MIERIAGESVLTFSPVYPERLYQVETTTDLDFSTPSPLTIYEETNDGNERTLVDKEFTGDIRRFYRVNIHPVAP